MGRMGKGARLIVVGVLAENGGVCFVLVFCFWLERG